MSYDTLSPLFKTAVSTLTPWTGSEYVHTAKRETRVQLGHSFVQMVSVTMQRGRGEGLEGGEEGGRVFYWDMLPNRLVNLHRDREREREMVELTERHTTAKEMTRRGSK